jgi:hypothetical protein
MQQIGGLWKDILARVKNMGGWFTPPSPGDATPFTLKVQCNRCGEVLDVRLNIYNDLSVEFDDYGNPTGYTCRKVLQGSGRCFQQMEVRLSFDSRRRLRDTEIRGGRILTEPPP